VVQNPSPERPRSAPLVRDASIQNPSSRVHVTLDGSTDGADESFDKHIGKIALITQVQRGDSELAFFS
jgi:hypothetical protein